MSGAAPRSCSATSPRRRLGSFGPPKELKAFAKVWLDPGESTTVQLKLEERDFANWDAGKPGYVALEERLRGSMWEGQAEPGWRVDPGRYGLHVGRSSADIAHVAHVTLD